MKYRPKASSACSRRGISQARTLAAIGWGIKACHDYTPTHSNELIFLKVRLRRVRSTTRAEEIVTEDEKQRRAQPDKPWVHDRALPTTKDHTCLLFMTQAWETDQRRRPFWYVWPAHWKAIAPHRIILGHGGIGFRTKLAVRRVKQQLNWPSYSIRN